MFSTLKKLFHKVAWAPVCVVLIHNGITKLIGHRQSLDPPMHLLGGAAMAYFFYQAIRIGHTWFGQPIPLVRSLIAFCGAVTTAVFWEFLEFTGGKITGVSSQISLDETMYDLIIGTAGALVYLFIMGMIKKIKKN